jgi:hypothetical protein
MSTYAPSSLGIAAPGGGFQQGGWYGGRQYWGGTLSEVNQIHPQSNQQGAGQQVSNEVVAQSAVQQGKTPEQMQSYLAEQKAIAAKANVGNVTPNRGVVAPTSGGGGGMGADVGTPQATLNLPDLYNTLYKSSGITDLEKQYSDQEKAFIEAKGKVNDNPFLSEATRVGRVAKLESLFSERTQNLKNDIATKKADIETKLNLETKQFDINSQAAQQALSRFNTLLSMGALNGATGDDIASITRATGISSSAIQAAINASNKKDVKTQVITSTNDAGVVTATVINAETGEVIAKNNLGAIGNAEKGGSGAPKPQTIGEQKASVEVSINSYVGNEALQAQISPEDLYAKLIQTYPEAIDYIKENWTASDIRKATK